MPTLPVILGDVRIRYLQETDFGPYVDLEKNGTAKCYVGGPNPKSEDLLLFNIRSYRPTTDLMAIAEVETDAYIGRCGFLDTQSNETELHIVIDPGHWHRGIGHRIVPFLVALARKHGKAPIAVIDPCNERSIGLLTKLGWKRTGNKQSDNYEDGFYVYKPVGI